MWHSVPHVHGSRKVEFMVAAFVIRPEWAKCSTWDCHTPANVRSEAAAWDSARLALRFSFGCSVGSCSSCFGGELDQAFIKDHPVGLDRGFPSGWSFCQCNGASLGLCKNVTFEAISRAPVPDRVGGVGAIRCT